jgi:hypothetical protein
MLLNFPQSIDPLIRLAIQRKRLVEVRYNGQSRIVEPHDYGSQRGIERLLVYQLRTSAFAGQHAVGWRLFDIRKIKTLIILDARFKGSRRTSDQDHHNWDALYARVE